MQMAKQIDDIHKIRRAIEGVLVPIGHLIETYGDWNPDCRVDPRLEARLDLLHEKCQKQFGSGFGLPVTSSYREFNPYGNKIDRKDASDGRGHWTGLAIDIGYRNVLGSEADMRAFVLLAKECNLYRIHNTAYGEWWHFSDYGEAYESWRPEDWIAKLRWEIINEAGIV